MHPRHSASARTFGFGRTMVISFAVIIGIWAGCVQSRGQTPDVEATLRQRMTGYWEAMQRSDYETASNFIHPDSRKLFIYRVARGTVVRWKIESLTFNADKTVCDTVTVVGRPVPVPIPGVDGVPDIPLKNQWVVAPDGQWYLKIPWTEKENPLLQLYKAQEDAAGKVAKPGEPPKTTTRLGGNPPSRLVPDPENPKFLHRGEKGTFRFHYTNTGTVPIKILSAHGDCHCTAVKQDNPAVAPGDSGTLEIIVDTFGLPFGQNPKTVSVQFSDMPEPVTFTLRINNLPNFTVTPLSVDFGATVKGKPVEKLVRIVNNSGRTVKIIGTYLSEPQLSMTLDKTEIAPDGAVTVTLRCSAAEEGEIRDSPMIRLDLDAEPLINIPIRGVIHALKVPEF